MEWGELLAEGIHELLLTRRLSRVLASRPELSAELASIDEADLPHTLGRHETCSLERVLKDARGAERQLEVVAGVLELLQDLDETPEAPPQVLKSVVASDRVWCACEEYDLPVDALPSPLFSPMHRASRSSLLSCARSC